MPSLDAIFLVPAFFEGGRLTVDDTHYVLEKGQRVPASETEFARDSVFGYNSAHLPTYIEEKTAGKVSAAAVQSISPELLNDGNALDSFLQGLTSSVYVVANAERYDQLHRLTSALRRALAQGKRFLFQSAASLVKSLAEVSDKPLLRGQELGDGGLGLVMVGSHVHKTTRQLDRLLAHEKTVGIEAEVDIIGERYETHLKTVAAALNAAWDTGYTPVVYTSRQEKHIPDADQRQQLGAAVSRFLVDVVRNISQPLAWCIAKGGITSHNILQKGLAVTQARVLGQILPGIPIVRVPRAGLCSGLTYIVFPGNVGDDEALLKVFEALAEDRSGRTR
jgi:uncharacterized protein YgbK (DUF1537 family)